MARINLLPWREAQRQERQRQFLVSIMLTAVMGVVLVFLAGLVFDQRISNQEARNRALQQEIARLQQRITRIEQLEATRDRLIFRKQIIEELQASRSMTVELLDQLAKSIPVGVTLTSIRQQGTNLTLNGTAQSNARVSAYLQSLQGNELFITPDLGFVRAATNPSNPVEQYEFSLRTQLRPVQAREGEGEELATEDVTREGAG